MRHNCIRVDIRRKLFVDKTKENLMGIIDSTIHSLTCDDCQVSENIKILDKGSNYGGSHWQSGKSFENFNSQWSGDGGKTEPRLISATCKKCGTSVQHKESFGG